MPRPRKPIEQKVLDGTYRPNKDGPLPAELQGWRKGDGPEPGPPEKPSDLSPEASKQWDHVLACSPVRIWPSHAAALTAYCEWWAMFKLCLGRALASAATPNLTSLGISTDKLLLLGAKFGLTPKDQSAMPVVESSGPKKAKTPSRPSGIDDDMVKPGSRRKKK